MEANRGDNMTISKLTTDPELVIQGLPDVPGISAAALKAKFDEGNGLIKTYINNTLTTEIDSELAGVVLGQIPDGTITLVKLASALQTQIDDATPIVGQTSTDTSGWTSTSTAGFTQKKDVAITGVTADDYPSVFFVAGSYVAAKDAEITFVEAYAGGITLYATAVPASTLTFDYVITKGQ